LIQRRVRASRPAFGRRRLWRQSQPAPVATRGGPAGAGYAGHHTTDGSSDQPGLDSPVQRATGAPRPDRPASTSTRAVVAAPFMHGLDGPTDGTDQDQLGYFPGATQR
jgi:hypothetical protein